MEPVRLVLLVTVIWLLRHIRCDLEPTFNHCCELGAKSAEDGADCGRFPAPVGGIPAEQQSVCLLAVEICCLRSYRKQQCNQGMAVAKAGADCLTVNQTGGEYRKDCCEACKLGIISGSMGMGCSFKVFSFQPPWDTSYQICCTQATLSPAQPLPSTFVAQTNVPPPLPAAGAATPENLCDLLPGQLCAHICVPIPGSYLCMCREGFTLMSDGKSCKQDDLPDRCKMNNPCLHKCQDTGLAVECSCNPGYQLHVDGRSCNDIDECVLGNDMCDRRLQRCRNQPGGYVCVNDDGSVSQPTVHNQPELPTDDGAEASRCPAGYQFNLNSQLCDDVNECMLGNPCGVSGLCHNTIGSYTCARVPVEDCQPGYRFSDSQQSCEDIDECRSSNNVCTKTQSCVNTVGSYMCVGSRGPTCPAGYKPNQQAENGCQDVDECAEGIDSCDRSLELCLNEIGSYKCDLAVVLATTSTTSAPKVDSVRCPDGYSYSHQRSTCLDVNECVTDLHNCTWQEECENIPGSFVCRPRPQCPKGYSYNASARLCQDVDECAEASHNCGPSEKCINQPGSFWCSPFCNQGFRLNSQGSCEDIDECSERLDKCHVPHQRCKNTKGSYTCVSIVCNPGTRLSHSGKCEDVDECAENTHSCSQDSHRCVNTPGSYRCVAEIVCGLGFHYNVSTSRCEDRDECTEGSFPCRAREECVNTPGSFYCARLPAVSNTTTAPAPICSAGFRYDQPRKQCLDINECQEQIHVCSAESEACINEPGGYRCLSRAAQPDQKNTSLTTTCEPGFKLESVRNTCVDIDECSESEESPCDSNQQCINTASSYTCICKAGYQLDPLLKACVDINECQVNQHDCLPSQRCDNTIGSFHCIRFTSCGTGYTLNAQTGLCEDDDECTLGTDNCRMLGPTFQCRNTFGSFRCERRRCDSNQIMLSSGECKSMNCAAGFETDQQGQCTDIDECTRSNPCRRNQRCLNTPGSYRCINFLNCGGGRQLNEAGTQCVDIDECATATHDCGPDQNCQNLPGGYLCHCPAGYTLSGKSCIDIDECTRFSGQVCDSRNSECMNTQGSYWCSCKSGFKQDASGKACTDVDECTDSPGICQQNCKNTWGSYQCTCNAGFYVHSDNRSCHDVDECEQYKDRNLCVGLCINEPGSYSCKCPQGYRLGSDGRTCQDLDECLGGTACQSTQDVCVNTRGSYRCNQINCPANFERDTEHKNRCKRVTPFCAGGGTCPLTYSFNFITFVSNIAIPPAGQLDLFTMRGPVWSSTSVRFTMEMLDARAPLGIAPVTKDFFRLRRPARNQAVISLVNSIAGPQEIELQLTMELHHNGAFGGSAVAKLFIYVSEYDF